jgi:ketosteroid isomerase-like protein
MYHAIVKRIARKNFERVNQKDFDALLKDCVPDVHHRFYGSHALGGERHDREALRRWFERLGRLGPGLTLTVRDVWVKGLPHDTTIIMRWSAKRHPLRRVALQESWRTHPQDALVQDCRYRRV